MKKLFLILLNAALAFGLYEKTLSADARAIPAGEADRILNRIIDKYSSIYRKYPGIESTSKNIIQEFDPETNELRSTSEVTLVRKDYYYAIPEVKVLSYKKDGKDLDTSKYRSQEAKPSHLLFDEKSGEHYEYKIAEKKKRNGRECYRIEVIPKKETSRHFRGEVFCAVDTLDMVYLSGGAAKLDFPLKDFWMEFHYALTNDIPVAQSGTMKVRVRVPGFYPDTLIVTTITIVESKLIFTK